MARKVGQIIASAFVAVVAALFVSHAIYAQTAASGGLPGVITDKSRAVLLDVNAEIRDIHQGNGIKLSRS